MEPEQAERMAAIRHNWTEEERQHRKTGRPEEAPAVAIPTNYDYTKRPNWDRVGGGWRRNCKKREIGGG